MRDNAKDFFLDSALISIVSLNPTQEQSQDVKIHHCIKCNPDQIKSLQEMWPHCAGFVTPGEVKVSESGIKCYKSRVPI